MSMRLIQGNPPLALSSSMSAGRLKRRYRHADEGVPAGVDV